MSILELFEREKCVYASAPMVRYSKLPFRELVRKYGCHLTYTPMTLAADFILSEKYRSIELQKSLHDSPLVMQFASTNDLDFGLAAGLVAPFVDGIDLNCGCPQRWAVRDGIGSALLDRDPQVVFDMVRAAKRNVQGSSDTPITIKIRLLPESNDLGSKANLQKTLEYCRQVEKSGISWLTVHGRTRRQKADSKVDYEAIKEICDISSVPVIANGDIFSKDDADRVQALTGCDGVMAARGLLENPMLFSDESGEGTTWECVNYFLERAISYGMSETLIFNHIVFMTSVKAKNLFESYEERENLIRHRNIFSLIDYVKSKATRTKVTEN